MLVVCVLLLINKYINAIREKNNKFVFDVKIIRSFENWLNYNLTLNMTKYIEEVLGAELKSEEELSLTPEFIQKGIDEVSAKLISEMPIFYRNYMTIFYGEDRLVVSIRERTRYLFIKFVENLAKKRAGGGLADLNSNKSDENTI